jgi:hypothetical protein
MTKPYLPHGYARCAGIDHHRDAWTSQCGACLRRVAPGGEHRQSWQMPPVFIDGECKDRIGAMK